MDEGRNEWYEETGAFSPMPGQNTEGNEAGRVYWRCHTMNGRPLAKALEHGMETMTINAKKSRPGVKICGDLGLERVWRP